MRYHVDVCGGTPVSPVPAYFPLTREEVLSLLKAAQDDCSSPEVSLVQVRLCQGIPGYVSPLPCKGEVRAKKHELDTLFVEGVKNRHDVNVMAAKILTIYGL